MILIFMFVFLTFLFYWVLKALFGGSKKHENHYIKMHQQKMHDDYQYDEYLEFCKQNGELPMEKSGFEELRMKEDAMKKKINESLK